MICDKIWSSYINRSFVVRTEWRWNSSPYTECDAFAARPKSHVPHASQVVQRWSVVPRCHQGHTQATTKSSATRNLAKQRRYPAPSRTAPAETLRSVQQPWRPPRSMPQRSDHSVADANPTSTEKGAPKAEATNSSAEQGCAARDQQKGGRRERDSDSMLVV